MSILTLNSIFGKYKKKIYVCFDLEANKISKAILFFDQKIDKILVVVVIIAYWYSQVPIKRVGPNERVGWIFYENFLNN